MFNALFSNIGKGLKKIKSNPQLIYTFIVAAITIGAFVFMADRFIGIANDAENRLVNVRVGSLQDTFVSFAADSMSDTDYLNKQIKNIMADNETMKNFRIIKKAPVADDNSARIHDAYVIAASNFQNEIGRADPQADFLYALATGDPTHSITYEFSQNGERMFSTARAITDANGNISGVVMTTQALSAADKAIQDEIDASLILLMVVIAVIIMLFLRHSKIVDYIDLYKKLQEVDQLKEDFISMASHELRTPLSIIRGYAEYICEAPELTPVTKDYAVKIDSSAKDLNSLIADILDVSTIQQGKMSFKMEQIDPQEILQGVATSFKKQAEDKGLALSLDVSKAEGNRSILADKDRLKQVFVNIIGNAVKYTIKGSIRVSEYIENKQLFIRVEDTGLGISAEEREHLFEKFYRIRTKETEDIRGTGLGLWITARIIKDMGGKILLESIKGVGSHFVIAFPINNK